MFHAPGWYHNVSLRLSDVLDDIGVNERLVLKRRRSFLLNESIEVFFFRLNGLQGPIYNLGSQSEGTTTMGLEADKDVVFCVDEINVIQHLNERSPGKLNLLMICDKSTPPGYCKLQVLRQDAAFIETEKSEICYEYDGEGRLLVKNTLIDVASEERKDLHRHGPAAVFQDESGVSYIDQVAAIRFKSLPQSARHRLEQVLSKWPAEAMTQYVATLDCFVVGTGSCASENRDFQWRISTGLHERYIMFNLNITQIRCYILLKMILKTFINLHGQTLISSYMCKTVLLDCIQCTPSHVWKKSNILLCLKYCLSKLAVCILCGDCPHVIIPGNNLMAGKITAENKLWLFKPMLKLIQYTASSLFEIQIDDLGQRLFMKLDMSHEADYNDTFRTKNASSCKTDFTLLINVVSIICVRYTMHLFTLKNESLENQIRQLWQSNAQLVRNLKEGTLFEQKACKLLAPLFCTSLGSLIASYNIQQNNPVCPQALKLLHAGINSDVSSNRLKLASVLYCTGDMEGAASILRDTEKRYNIDAVQPVCRCYLHAMEAKLGIYKKSTQYHEEGLIYMVAFCVKFLPSEINCFPKELQYELFRSTKEERQHTEKDDAWMDLAAVDSSPYLYFLQYKTYSNLKRVQEQQQSLQNMINVTYYEKNLGHRETAFNLLGQCMEQENRPSVALSFYCNSLIVRQTNNVARFHICRLLASLIALRQENS